MIKKQWRKILLTGFLFAFAFSMQQSALSISDIRNIFAADNLHPDGHRSTTFQHISQRKAGGKPNVEIIPEDSQSDSPFRTKGYWWWAIHL